jgi:hypothetical protein
MPFSRRLFLIASLATVSTVAARADDPKKPAPPLPGPEATPEDIVKNLYDSFAIVPGFDYMGDKLRPRYFSQATNDLLKKVFTKSEADNEPGIDYEPLIDGQDGEVKGLTIAATTTTPTKVTVEARFTSFDDKMTVIFDFVLEKNTWKIDDIRNKEGNSLKAVAKDFLQ